MVLEIAVHLHHQYLVLFGPEAAVCHCQTSKLRVIVWVVLRAQADDCVVDAVLVVEISLLHETELSRIGPDRAEFTESGMNLHETIFWGSQNDASLTRRHRKLMY
jgi:hypothetical protein